MQPAEQLTETGRPSGRLARSGVLRRRVSSARSDQRGFALQTAIITAVLIVIAAAVSAVLLDRGGDVVNDLERQRVTASPSAFKAEAPCVAAGFTWSDNGTPADDSDDKCVAAP